MSSEEQLASRLWASLAAARGFAVYRLRVDLEQPALCVVDFVSPSITHVMGIPSDAPVDEWLLLVHPEDAERVAISHVHALREGALFDEIFRIYHYPKAEWVWIHAVSRLEEIDGEGERFHSGTIVDVTENQRLLLEREELSRERARLHRLESLGVLAARIAHDFNNQLAAIQACVSVAVHPKSAGTERPKAMLHEITAIVASAQRSTKDVLAYALADTGRAVTLHFDEVVGDAVRVAENAKPTTPYRVESRRNVIVRGDRGQLERLLTNLLVNASDASPAGAPVDVRLRVEAGAAVVEVEDHGEGMDAETQRRVFEPFFSTKQGAGSGLGLAGAQQLAEQHHGTLEVHSEPGVGTCMTLRIPLAPPEPMADASETAMAAARAHLAQLGEGGD
ncbi:MAG: hypothetical protein CMN30_24600 [Sandaracinus sp.]|nr:hypothetical protein [Sandaracinus sp.]